METIICGVDASVDWRAEVYASVRPGLPEEPRELLQRYIEEGRLGVKSGGGFYDDYSD